MNNEMNSIYQLIGEEFFFMESCIQVVLFLRKLVHVDVKFKRWRFHKIILYSQLTEYLIFLDHLISSSLWV